MPTFQSNTTRVHYEVHGDGPAVVLGHGLGGDLNQPKELAGRLPAHQLVVWDCRGHGRTQSSSAADQFNFVTFARDARALLDHLRIPAAVIGGISMGAGVAARFAVQWPERVRALVLVRPAWLDQPSPPQLRLFTRIADLLESVGAEKGLAVFQEDAEWQAMRRAAPAMADSLCQQFIADRAYERRARLKQIPAASPIEHWQQAASLHMPALVVGNRMDPIHPFEFAEIWARHLPRAQLVEIPSKSESPAEHQRAFQRHFTRFLATLANL